MGVLCLNDVAVDENSNYKKELRDWEALLRSGSGVLYKWTRPNAQVPAHCVPSLQLAMSELRRLDLR